MQTSLQKYYSEGNETRCLPFFLKMPRRVFDTNYGCFASKVPMFPSKKSDVFIFRERCCGEPYAQYPTHRLQSLSPDSFLLFWLPLPHMNVPISRLFRNHCCSVSYVIGVVSTSCGGFRCRPHCTLRPTINTEDWRITSEKRHTLPCFVHIFY